MTVVPVILPISSGSLLHNKYEPIKKIGNGNFGEVWLARDRALDHTFAIKILKAGVKINEKLKEAQIGHSFTHNNLVKVHQADVLTDGRVIIAMDYLPDGPITTLANPANFLTLPQSLRVIIDVLQGLEHLHASNLFHNDIKPENILLGTLGQAKLGDYGIVGVSTDGKPVPEPARYILHGAPETIGGNGIDARTDIFQTGLTLYRLLAGLGLLRAKLTNVGQHGYEAALVAGKLIQDGDFPPFVPRAVVRVIKKSIHPDPSQRYQSALEMRRALEGLNFAGHWTVNANGTLIGIDGSNEYRFEKILTFGDKSSFSAFKKNLSSGRETRISKFSQKSIISKDMHRLNNAFIKAVVDGAL